MSRYAARRAYVFFFSPVSRYSYRDPQRLRPFAPSAQRHSAFRQLWAVTLGPGPPSRVQLAP